MTVKATETTATETTTEPANEPDTAPAEPFRFFDNREKYLLFVTTTSEKAEVAARIGRELDHLAPKPPALRVFDAGTGNGVVLSNVLRHLHRQLPTVPFLAVGKEISMEDTRLTLSQLPDRLAEHAPTVVALTNMKYSEAPWLNPFDPADRSKMRWWNIPLAGSTAHEFAQQIDALDHVLTAGWQTTSSPKTGNPTYAIPSVVVLYRADQAFALNDVIPRQDRPDSVGNYDLVLAAQPYRCRTPAETKVKLVLGPLAKALGSGGRLVVAQSTGHDPGMEIIRRVWPAEEPFATPRHLLIRELDRQLNGAGTPVFTFEGTTDAQALFTYHLHAMPNEVSNRISTSTAMAAWNAAVYVAQIDDERVSEALQSGRFVEPTREVVLKHGGLWFQDECFVVVRS